MEPRNSRAAGKHIEDLACSYLLRKGLKLRAANYSCKFGEIDLIMEDREFLVFVEVRFRQREDYGGPHATVSVSKQRKIARTALFYLQEKNLFEKVPCRFDVIAVQQKQAELEFDWIKSAFEVIKRF